MTTVRAANVAKLTAVLSNGPKKWINSFHVEYGGVAPLSGAEATALAANFSNIYRTRFMGAFNNSVFSVQFEAADIDPAGFATGIDTTSVSGLVAGDIAPLSAAVMALWRTEAPRYRGGKPRTYFGGISASDYVDGFTLVGARQAVWQGLATNWISDLNAMSFGTGPRSVTFIDLAVRRNKAPLPTPEQFPVLSAVVGPNLRSQRRRIEP